MPAAALLMVAGLLAFAVDQASKAWLTRAAGESAGALGPWLWVHLNLRHNARPSRIRLGLRASTLLWAVVALASAACMALTSAIATPAVVGLGLALGGAAGNLLDRWRHGAVIDFIALGRWPTFNLADAAMVAGAVLVATSWC